VGVWWLAIVGLVLPNSPAFGALTVFWV